MKHPARFSERILATIGDLIPASALVLDPFAGTGLIHRLPQRTVGLELEPEWATMHPRTIVGSTLALPFANETFDVIATSPCYGNRMADHHEAKDGSYRRSYRHDLGRPLSADNSGQLQWGEAYREFHRAAWTEAARVLRGGGRLVLNIKDHVRAGKLQSVPDWHVRCLQGQGLEVCSTISLPHNGMRFGANRHRSPDELIYVFEKGIPE